MALLISTLLHKPSSWYLINIILTFFYLNYLYNLNYLAIANIESKHSLYC